MTAAKKAGILWDLFLFCGAVFLYVVAGRYGAFAGKGQLGPDFWPRVILALMALFALMDLALHLRGPREPESLDEPAIKAQSHDASGVSAVVGCMALLVAYVAVLPYVGFYLTTMAFMPLVLLLAAYKSPWVVAVGVLGTTGLTYVFQAWLGVNFPIGIGIFQHATIALYHALHVF